MSTPIHSARHSYGDRDAATVAANNYAERLKSEVKTANLELEVERLRQELEALKAQHEPSTVCEPTSAAAAIAAAAIAAAIAAAVGPIVARQPLAECSSRQDHAAEPHRQQRPPGLSVDGGQER